MHKVLVNLLGGLSLSRKSVVRLTDRPDMTLDVYRGRKITTQQQYSTTPLRDSDSRLQVHFIDYTVPLFCKLKFWRRDWGDQPVHLCSLSNPYLKNPSISPLNIKHIPAGMRLLNQHRITLIQCTCYVSSGMLFQDHLTIKKQTTNFQKMSKVHVYHIENSKTRGQKL